MPRNFLPPPNKPSVRPAPHRDQTTRTPSDPLKSQSDPVPVSPSVRWTETRTRDHYEVEYVTIGSIPGLIRQSFESNDTVRKLLSDSVILSRRSTDRVNPDEHARLVSALLAKLLQRGRLPLPTLEIERALIDAYQLTSHVVDLSEGDVEMGWGPKSYRFDKDEFVAHLAQRRTFNIEAGFVPRLLDSPYEVQFITKWVPEHLGDNAGHWFTPQAPLETLLERFGTSEVINNGERRVDFLVDKPGINPFIVEIDGPEHLENIQVDRRRDATLLNRARIDVIRVANAEVIPNRNQPSPTNQNLAEVKRKFGDPPNTGKPSSKPQHNAKLADFAFDCSVASKIQFILARAVSYGWLSGEKWNIDLAGGGTAAVAAVLDTLRLFTAYDSLYGGKATPEVCTLRTDGNRVTAWLCDNGQWFEIQDAVIDKPTLKIRIERNSSPFDELPNAEVDFIVRPAFLPVEFSVDLHSDFPRTQITTGNYEDAEPALTFFLQNVFRKQNFRSGQGESIWRTLRQKDTIVLLPTAGGKSIIYQLSGLLMPGITLVIDPIVALIEDQVDGLRRYGIERVTGISSAMGQTERQAILHRAERGEFQFILMAPERLQSPEFRGTVGALRSRSLINLAVIDEAHCVSEWGHEFRPAYLRLADTLRSICRDMRRTAPPLLALTGTASRAVLRDMMIELGVDQSRGDNVVRPDSFDRKELKFEIRRERTSRTAMDTLGGVLQSLPHRFHGQASQFFNTRGRETSSGIVFVRTVNALESGLMPTRDTVSNATRTRVATYSGGTTPRGYNAQDWEEIKRQNARSFKDNRVPILVATKAFGMGIDKPNIRFVVHNGMPGSIESYYQEAGRAGRDQREARCVAVFSECDKQRSNDWLNGEADLEQIRASFRRHENDWDRKDDVTTALFFHLNSFRGVGDEIGQVANVLNHLGDLTEENSVRIAFRSETEQQRVEYAVVRLIRVGVVSDYTVDWNQKQLSVNVPRFEFEYCKSTVVEHIRLAQPWRSSVFAERVGSIPDGEPRESAKALVSVLIEFTYDAIERGRRQAIREAVELARNASEDADIRRRIIDYLEEGVHTERIDELLSNTQIDLYDWYELIHKMQTAVDAGGLRGLTGRALESYPDHPGLRFTRGASEAMCSDRANRVGIDHFTEGVQAGVKYRVDAHHISKLIADLYEFGETRAPMLLPLLTWGVLQLDSNEEQYRSFRLQAFDYARSSQQPQAAAAGAAFALDDAVDQAEDAVDRWRNRYSQKCLQLLGIA